MMPLSRFVLRTLPLCALLVPGLVSAESATPTAAPKTTSTPKAAATSKATASPEKATPKAEKTPKPATAADTASGDKADAKPSKGSMNMGDMFGGGSEFDLKTGPGGTLFTTTKDNALVKLIAKDPNGQVVVTNPQFTLHCETLTYVDATKQAVALGNPVTVEQPTSSATCKKLEMYPGDTENKFVLTGNPVMRQKGQSSVTGDRITIIQHKADGSVDTFVDSPHVISTGSKTAVAPTTAVKQPTATPSGGATIEIDTTKGGLKEGGISLPGMKSSAAPAPKSNQP